MFFLAKGFDFSYTELVGIFYSSIYNKGNTIIYHRQEVMTKKPLCDVWTDFRFRQQILFDQYRQKRIPAAGIKQYNVGKKRIKICQNKYLNNSLGKITGSASE